MSPAPPTRVLELAEIDPARDVLATVDDLLPTGTQPDPRGTGPTALKRWLTRFRLRLVPEHDLTQKAPLVQAQLRLQLAQTRRRVLELQASLSSASGGGEARVQAIQSLISVRPSHRHQTEHLSKADLHCMFPMQQELLEQTTRIKEKSLESEAVVRSITRDIQVLDLGKRNLTASLSLLRGLEGLSAS